MNYIDSDVLADVKQFMKRYIRSMVPGYLEILNIYSMRIYGKDVIDLFFESPSKVYDILLQHYKDSFTADFAISRLFLRPISLKANNILLEESLLELIKNRKDDEVLKAVSGALKK